MATKDWLVPLLVGAVGFAGLALMPMPQAHETTLGDASGVQVVLATHADNLPSHDPGPELVVSETARPLGNETLRLTDYWCPIQTDVPVTCIHGGSWPVVREVRWVTPHVGLREVPQGRDGLCEDVCEMRRLGVDGYNATRVTVHVLDAEGELVFSNGNASDQERLVRNLTPQQLPAGVWYLGDNATAPAGTAKLPLAAQAFLGGYRDQLQGLDEGAVLTVQTDALKTWYGPLWITLRIEELVFAP